MQENGSRYYNVETSRALSSYGTGKADANLIMACKKKEVESIRAYYDRFTIAMLNIQGHEEFLFTNAFAQGLFPGPLSKKM